MSTGKGHLRSYEVINSFLLIDHDVIVLKTCRWYQTACLVMKRRLIYDVTFLGHGMTLLGQILKMTYQGHQVQSVLNYR